MSDLPPPPPSGPSGPDPGGFPPPPPPPPAPPPLAPDTGYPPPPPPGGYPPPPPPPNAVFGGQPGWAGPAAGPLAEWGQRVVGTLADGAIVLVGYIAVFIVAFILGKIAGALGALVLVFGYLAILAYVIVQLIKQGNTGQTLGKKVVGLKVIKEETGQPIGPGLSIGRQICHVVDSLICYVGWLFPLWDAKKQTIADKLVGTVVVQVPKQSVSTVDLYTVH